MLHRRLRLASVDAHSVEQELHDDAVEQFENHAEGFALETGVHLHHFFYEAVHVCRPL